MDEPHEDTESSSQILTLGSLILHEHLENIDVLRSWERISTNTNAQRLSKTDLCGFCSSEGGSVSGPDFIISHICSRSTLRSGRDISAYHMKSNRVADSRLICQGSRARDYTSRTRREDVSRHDTDLATSTNGRCDDTRAVGSHEPGLGLTTQYLGDLLRGQIGIRARSSSRELDMTRTRTSSA